VLREYIAHVLKIKRYSSLRKTEEKRGHNHRGFRNMKIKLEIHWNISGRDRTLKSVGFGEYVKRISTKVLQTFPLWFF
jgi:hypothetical protein